jgi:uncharacterized protein (TIGR02996 family)
VDEADFVAPILAAPDDDAPRLVYADWLVERGDARGELIQTDCALARLPRFDRQRRVLVAPAPPAPARALVRVAARRRW